MCENCHKDFVEEYLPIDWGTVDRVAIRTLPNFNAEPSPCDNCSNKGKVCHCTLGGPKITC